MKRLRTGFIIGIILCCSTAALAASEKTIIDQGMEHWADRHWAIQLRISPGGLVLIAVQDKLVDRGKLEHNDMQPGSTGPGGFLAIGLDRTFAPYFSVSAELGFTPKLTHFNLSLSPHVTLMPRLRLPLRQHGVYVGSGLSLGDYNLDPHGVRIPARGLWSNSELGYEFQTGRSFGIRVFAGYSYGIKISTSCEKNRCSAGRFAFYGGVAWSWRLQNSLKSNRSKYVP